MKIYVGNLPFSTTSSDLETLFARFGSVESAQVITDRDTGRSRGFGFVEMGDDDGRRAIEGLNDQDFDGRRLKINEARPREANDRRSDRGRAGGWSR
jgi:RNA recognition motif-containing protein